MVTWDTFVDSLKIKIDINEKPKECIHTTNDVSAQSLGQLQLYLTF